MWLVRLRFPDTMVLGGFAMAQREQHERVKRMDRWAEKLLGHKAVVVAILVVIAAASGLAMASFNSHSGGVSFERSDEASTSDVRGSGDASPDDESSAKSSSAAEVYVDVDGAVVRPGVYRLKDGARVSQAIDAAGGLTAEADVAGLNRASKVTDGQKIYVPTVGEQQAAAAVGGAESGAATTPGAGSSSELVNINTASAAELQTLSGIGPSMAQSIIDERTKNGAFASVDDLMRVSGIGEKKLAKIKDCICV
jgi:competence protein ComEA